MTPIRPATVTLYLATLLGLAACNGAATEEAAVVPEAAEALAVRFTDVTQSAGLGDFRHVNGAYGRRWFPEAMGSGGGLVDVNGDGWLDAVLASGGIWPESDTLAPPAVRLYMNDGDGTFTEATAAAGLADHEAYSFGVTAGDYDGDGDDDLFITTLFEDLLYRNDGDGTFEEVAEAAGVAGGETWSTSALFFDPDRDGDLDLYVGSYVDWSYEQDIPCTVDGQTRSYCTPELYTGLPSRFYRNQGDGTFTDETEPAGFADGPGKTLGVAEFDYNRDGWPDLVVASDTQRDLLYENDGDGTFTEKGALAGVAYDENGSARAGMGIDVGVVDTTGRETMFVGNFSKEMIAVYRDAGTGFFVDRAAASKIGRPTLLTLTFGLFLFDADLDGDLDLFAANGHVQPEIEVTQEGITYAEPPHLFLNDGYGQFRDAAAEAGLREPLVARGAAYGDVDRDGDVDILITENTGPARLYRNDLEGAGWLRVHLEGRESNPNAYGAQLTAYVDGRPQHRRVRSGGSFMAHSEPTVTFGLGAAPRLDSLVVAWPSGRVDRLRDLAAGQTLRLVEGETDALNVSALMRERVER